MVTILLEKIISILTGWFSAFKTWAENVAEKLGLIEEQAEYIDDIYENVDSITAATSSIKTDTGLIRLTLNNANARLTQIYSDTSTIKNNVGSISTNTGISAAFAEDIATNTLNINNRLVTIGSDTTQIRADSTSLAADVAEIKDTLGLYLYNTIVSEDAEGAIALCDTDLKDYLQEAKVTIPADAGGITDINLIQTGINVWNENIEEGSFDTTTGAKTPNTSLYRSVTPIAVKPNTQYRRRMDSSLGCRIFYYDSNMGYISQDVSSERLLTITTPSNCYYINIAYQKAATGVSINYPATYTNYNSYNGNNYPISFTSITDGAEIDLITGLIKINTSPVTYDSITPIAIRTYKGINNFYSDIGTTAVTYRETLKHYLKKQEA